MKRYILVSLIITLIVTNLFAQQERKVIREGNKNYKEKNYVNALNNFLYADSLINNSSEKSNEEKEKLQLQLNNNIAASRYRNNSFDPAVENYKQIIEKTTDSKVKADAYYNIGNSYLQAKEYQKSIDAYKNALRNNPNHDKSRYNMAVATKAQQQQQQQNKNNDQKNQDKKNQDKQDQQGKNKDKQDKDKDNKKDGKNNEKNDEKKDDKSGSQEKEMNKEEMERFLEALQEKDKEVQEKAKEQQITKNKKITEKEW